jgi:hypothetical protein
MKAWKAMLMILLAAVSLPAQGLAAAQEAAGGTVAGRLETIEGEPVAGAVVSLLPAEPGVPVTRNLMARTDELGGFSISGVPDGKYRACVPFAEGALLDPCLWGGFPVGVEVKGGAGAPARLRVVVAEGAELTLLVADPDGVLAGVSEAARKRPALDVRVYRPGTPLLAMRLSGQSGAARQYRLAVPVETALTLTVASRDVVLAEAADGRPELSADTDGLKAELKLPRETKTKVLRVQVSGSKQEAGKQ